MASINVCHHAVCLTLTMHCVMTRGICCAAAGLECPHPFLQQSYSPALSDAFIDVNVSSSCTLFASAVELRKGPKVDLTKSRVLDPKSIPVDSASRKLPQTMWRVDRLRDMTYTQFWHLIQERQIARVSDCPLHVRAAGQLHVIHLCCTVSVHQLILPCIMSAVPCNRPPLMRRGVRFLPDTFVVSKLHMLLMHSSCKVPETGQITRASCLLLMHSSCKLPETG